MLLPRPSSLAGALAGALTLALAAAPMAGCGAGPRAVRPSDFAGEPAPREAPASPAAAGAVPAAETPAAVDRVDPLPGRPRVAAAETDTGRGGAGLPVPEGPLVLDGLVGQINGQAVYADELLADLDAQLAALGRRLEPPVFRRRAAELIESSLRERLINALILGEAERGLTEQQQAGVRYMVAERREDLLRRMGRGSLSVARKRLLEETGLTLDQTLRQYREAVVTKNHLDGNLTARINVSRRDVERFYRENPATFRPPVTRDLDLIWVDDADAAEDVAARLDAGEPFDAVAADPAVGNAWSSGRMTSIIGDQPFGRPAVDEAVAGLLETGARAGPVVQPSPDGGERFWFVRAAVVDRPEGRSLLEAQAAIEQTLRERQFVRLRDRFVERLKAEGSFTPLEAMAGEVLQIAVHRYSRSDA